MERWQSTYEHRVAFNLSESGVHPLTLAGLLELAPAPASLEDALLGYGQSNGSDELRARIAALYPGATESNVVVTSGGAEANFAATWELVEPGSHVVVVTPTYMQTYGLAEGFGARLATVPLREELGWQPDPADLRRAIGTATRLVIVTNPNNPTGAVLADEPRRALLAASSAAGAWVLSDEVYSGAELAGSPTPSLWGDYERVVATGSLSKAYGLPGLRIGWAVAPPDLASRIWARTDYTTIAPATLSDRLAALALGDEVRPRILRRTREILRAALPVLEDWAGRLDGVQYRRPDAGAICWFRYDHDVPSLQLAERLRVEQDVLLVPGQHFDMDRHFRIGYGLPPHDLETALARVTDVLADLRPARARSGGVGAAGGPLPTSPRAGDPT